MKNVFLLFFVFAYTIGVSGYPKKSIIERYTNSSCGPCASINNSWYNATTAGLLATNAISHIVYNVNWPAANDPMYLLNPTENAVRWTYYGVNSVPWIVVNGATVNTDQGSMTAAVTNGNALVSPFQITLVSERFSNSTINVKVKIKRAANDVTVFPKTALKVGLTERTVQFPQPLGNGESIFYSITRKMLPDAKGTVLTIPAPGDSIEIDLMYVPTSAFKSAVNFDSLRIVAYIQNEATKEIYQSEMQNLMKVSHINAAFTISDNLGASPMSVDFTNYSTPGDSGSITSYKWDFNNDGTIESTLPNPSFTYFDKNIYSVALTVTDNKGNTTKRILKNVLQVIGRTADILVVNGIDYSNAAYQPEMTNFYSSNAVYGNHDVDVWDLFGDQGFNYSVNTKVKQVDLFNRKIPFSVMKLYKRIIWIGNNYSGDASFYDAASVLKYVKEGGNFLLATRMASYFFETLMINYCGIGGISGDMTLTGLTSLNSNLVNMNSIATNSLVHYVMLDSTKGAIPLFKVDQTWNGGFRINKSGEGNFIYIAGRPYRFDLAASAANYNYIIDNFMNSTPVDAKDNLSKSVITDYKLDQNYPNPFNPSTKISYALPYESNVKIIIYNTIGEVVQEIVSTGQLAGTYSTNFNANKLSSGVYLYSINAISVDGKQNFNSTKKMLLLK